MRGGTGKTDLTHVQNLRRWSYLVVTVPWLPKAAVPSARVAEPDSSAKYCGKSLACSLPKVCRERFLQGGQGSGKLALELLQWGDAGVCSMAPK